jgi:hypothetical protein
MVQKCMRAETNRLACACETLTRVIDTVTSHIAIEESKAMPNLRYIADLNLMRSDLSFERTSLSISDYADITRIFEVYGKSHLIPEVAV